MDTAQGSSAIKTYLMIDTDTAIMYALRIQAESELKGAKLVTELWHAAYKKGVEDFEKELQVMVDERLKKLDEKNETPQ